MLRFVVEWYSPLFCNPACKLMGLNHNCVLSQFDSCVPFCEGGFTSFLERHRAYVTDGAVAADSIVVDFDVFKHAFLGFFRGFESKSVDDFGFE